MLIVSYHMQSSEFTENFSTNLKISNHKESFEKTTNRPSTNQWHQMRANFKCYMTLD